MPSYFEPGIVSDLYKRAYATNHTYGEKRSERERGERGGGREGGRERERAGMDGIGVL
jgi:hypothetical protein